MTVQEISRVIDGKRVIVKKPELLIPAGNLEKLKQLSITGQMLYIQVDKNLVFVRMQVTLRQKKWQKALSLQKYGAKIYVTTNIFAHNENMDGLEEYLKGIEKLA